MSFGSLAPRDAADVVSAKMFDGGNLRSEKQWRIEERKDETRAALIRSMMVSKVADLSQRVRVIKSEADSLGNIDDGAPLSSTLAGESLQERLKERQAERERKKKAAGHRVSNEEKAAAAAAAAAKKLEALEIPGAKARMQAQMRARGEAAAAYKKTDAQLELEKLSKKHVLRTVLDVCYDNPTLEGISANVPTAVPVKLLLRHVSETIRLPPAMKKQFAPHFEVQASRDLLRSIFWYVHLNLFYPTKVDAMQTLLRAISLRYVQISGSLGVMVLQGSISPLKYRSGIDTAGRRPGTSHRVCANEFGEGQETKKDMHLANSVHDSLDTLTASLEAAVEHGCGVTGRGLNMAVQGKAQGVGAKAKLRARQAQVKSSHRRIVSPSSNSKRTGVTLSRGTASIGPGGEFVNPSNRLSSATDINSNNNNSKNDDKILPSTRDSRSQSLQRVGGGVLSVKDYKAGRHKSIHHKGRKARFPKRDSRARCIRNDNNFTHSPLVGSIGMSTAGDFHKTIRISDSFFRVYPVLIANAVCWAFRFVFPQSRNLFNQSVKDFVVRQTYSLLFGIDICNASLYKLSRQLFPADFSRPGTLTEEELRASLRTQLGRDTLEDFGLPTGVSSDKSQGRSASLKGSSAAASSAEGVNAGAGGVKSAGRGSDGKGDFRRDDRDTAATVLYGRLHISVPANVRHKAMVRQKSNKERNATTFGQRREVFNATAMSPVMQAYLQKTRAKTNGLTEVTFTRTVPTGKKGRCRVGGIATYQQQHDGSNRVAREIQKDYGLERQDFKSAAAARKRANIREMQDHKLAKKGMLSSGGTALSKFCLDMAQGVQIRWENIVARGDGGGGGSGGGISSSCGAGGKRDALISLPMM